MKYLLDSNVCIRYLNGRSASIKSRIDSIDTADVVVCSIVKAELLFGSRRSQNPAASREAQQRLLAVFESLPFNDAAAEAYALIRADLTAKGTPIGANDYLIAAIALANDLILVTHNTREFGRVSGLKLEDWEAENS